MNSENSSGLNCSASELLFNIGQERTMVFVDKKKKADYIAAFLCQEKIVATSIHG